MDNISQPVEWINCPLEPYRIVKSRFGLYTSIDKNDVRMTTALTEEACRLVTEDIHLPVRHHCFTGWTSQGRSSTVDGKL
tara:strand:+ start:2037 stop:2276 length:240 start_codon:yes stop_codon:yes gene_type:complete